MSARIDDEIVLVASTAQRPHDGYRTLMTRFDMPKALSNRILLYSLRKICKTVHFYNEVSAFIEQLPSHRDHLIFPYYYTVGSRINNAYVQSICESSGMRFVGPESYALTVCNDKVLSKDICRFNGLKTPRCVVLYTKDGTLLGDLVTPPLIVKPVFEGNSIGINKESVCHSFEDAEKKARDLHSKIAAPVMLEEFIHGIEVNICILGDGQSNPLVRAVLLNKNGDIYDYKQKHKGLGFNRYNAYSGEEISHNMDVFLNIYKMLGKVEFMRIDCIIRDGQLFCIELTPDADLSISSALYRSVSDHLSYTGFLKRLILHSNQYYRNQ